MMKKQASPGGEALSHWILMRRGQEIPRFLSNISYHEMQMTANSGAYEKE